MSDETKVTQEYGAEQIQGGTAKGNIIPCYVAFYV
mgnify:CR=1 FL=1